MRKDVVVVKFTVGSTIWQFAHRDWRKPQDRPSSEAFSEMRMQPETSHRLPLLCDSLSHSIWLLSYWSHNLSRTPSYCQWDQRLSAGTHKDGCVPQTVPQHSTWGPSKLPFKHILSWIIILGGFATFRQTTISFVTTVCLPACLSVRPHGTTRLPLDGFSLNLKSEYFWKICRENSSCIKIWQE